MSDLLMGFAFSYLGAGLLFLLVLFGYAKFKGSKRPRAAALGLVWVTWPLWAFLALCILWMLLKARILFPPREPFT